jgi:hypothetical protein
MDRLIGTYASEEKSLPSNLYIVGAICLVGILLAMCAVLLFPDVGAKLGPFTLS